MLAEETVNPRRNVPRALITGTLAIGVLYVFLAYSTEVAFHDNAAAHRQVRDSLCRCIQGLCRRPAAASPIWPV